MRDSPVSAHELPLDHREGLPRPVRPDDVEVAFIGASSQFSIPFPRDLCTALPWRAKSRSDQHAVVQSEQDHPGCRERPLRRTCRPQLVPM